MYWKGMRHTIQKYVKSCRSCQVNKRHSQKYGHVPPKLVITTPWRVLCVDLIGPYTLNGKVGSSIDFMCLTMIDPMTASVSDFARLIAFTEASKPSGFGVGQIEWCSQEGTARWKEGKEVDRQNQNRSVFGKLTKTCSKCIISIEP